MTPELPQRPPLPRPSSASGAVRPAPGNPTAHGAPRTLVPPRPPIEQRTPPQSLASSASPDPTSTDNEARERKLVAAVRDYTAALEAGTRPNRRELLARNPDIAAELSACLAGLSFVQSAAGQLARAQTAAPPPAGSAPALGQPLGDFRLVREIGRGGMGVVYEAEQMSLSRRVAVKVLPMAAALDARRLQRFRNEAAAAAQLHHAHIVPVYAVGCERSVHFYAMQLIEGQSLADVIREMRRVAGRSALAADEPPEATEAVVERERPMSTGYSFAPGVAGAPRDELDASRSEAGSAVSLSSLRDSRTARGAAYWRAAARLGLQAAEALDYAHRSGVVHRDIKPANLLLDHEGTLWITDFGLAQFYADTGLTQTGDMLGTLRYMSPEQASGRAVILDQRTDVYSLGATLYEMLTLEPAAPGQTREELLRQIDGHDPRPARSIDRAIPRELETILIRATARDVAERYPTARALADDLHRFLHDEPILARPPSLWDKSIKWTRRHRAMALSAVAALLIAAGGLLTSTLLIAREQGRTRAAWSIERDKATEAAQQRALADQQRSVADQQRALAEQQKARADRSFEQARDAVDYFSRVAANELADTPESAEVRKEMLEAALDYYEGFLEAHAAEPTVDAALAEARAYTARILEELSAFQDFDRADADLRMLSLASVQKALGLSAAQEKAVELISPEFYDERARDLRLAPGGGALGGARPPLGDDDGGPGGIRRAGPSRRPGANFGPGVLRPEGTTGADDLDDGSGPPRLHEMTEQQKLKRFADGAARIESALKKALTPAQLDRLAQISRQVRMPGAFSDRDVVAALGLTREQKEAIRKAQASFRIYLRQTSRRPGPPGARGRGRTRGADDPQSPDSLARRTEAVDQALAQLTARQRAVWAQLVGASFPEAASIDFELGQFGKPDDGPPDEGPPGEGPGRRGPGGPDDDGLGGPGRDRPGLDGPGLDGPGRDGPGRDGPEGNGPGRDGPGRRPPGVPGFDPGAPGADGPGPGFFDPADRRPRPRDEAPRVNVPTTRPTARPAPATRPAVMR